VIFLTIFFPSSRSLYHSGLPLFSQRKLQNEQFKVKFFHASVNLEKELLASDWD
jgi:hypothetical protein